MKNRQSEENYPPEEPKSKTQVKQEMTALQKLGERLLELPRGLLLEMPLDDDLRGALDAARTIHSRSALRRQLQFIGKLMRGADAEGIRQALERFEQGRRQAARAFHQVEAQRDELIEGADPALQAYLDTHPRCERQQLRQLVRNAVRERETGKPAGAARKLFRYLQGQV